MELLSEENPIGAKTRELCTVLASSIEFASIRSRIDRFSEDTEARMQFDLVNRKGQQLQQKQESGTEITSTEVAEFERLREALIANDIAREFLEAREEMISLQEGVQQWVAKTFELGRSPSPDEMGGSCGPGCGCA
jgi:cell fate (sporulation/competence/biofilm development) regulator YlbF (YheA/YmcA/DUF963 family)